MRTNNIQLQTLTVSEYLKTAQTFTIYYSVFDSPLGFCLIAVTQHHICWFSFLDDPHQQNDMVDLLQATWKGAKITPNTEETTPAFRNIFATENKTINLLLKGTSFQLKVWQALLSIPNGEQRTYEEIAALIQQPTATRASASAIAKNNIAYLIPCHRVIRKNGDTGQYRWGSERKKALLLRESSL